MKKEETTKNKNHIDFLLSEKFDLIPMHEITDLARSIAVRWLACEDPNWIMHKHKLASDIMRYAEIQIDELRRESSPKKPSVINPTYGNKYDMLMEFNPASENNMPDRNEYVLIRTRYCIYPCVVGKFNGVKWIDIDGCEIKSSIEWSPIYNKSKK